MCSLLYTISIFHIFNSKNFYCTYIIISSFILPRNNYVWTPLQTFTHTLCRYWFQGCSTFNSHARFVHLLSNAVGYSPVCFKGSLLEWVDLILKQWFVYIYYHYKCFWLLLLRIRGLLHRITYVTHKSCRGWWGSKQCMKLQLDIRHFSSIFGACPNKNHNGLLTVRSKKQWTCTCSYDLVWAHVRECSHAHILLHSWSRVCACNTAYL